MDSCAHRVLLADPDGLASGSYKPQINLNGKLVTSKGFSVR